MPAWPKSEIVAALARNSCFLEQSEEPTTADELAAICQTTQRLAMFRFSRYAALQRTWTRKRFRVALPAADPPDNHKKTVHMHADLAQAA